MTPQSRTALQAAFANAYHPAPAAQSSLVALYAMLMGARRPARLPEIHKVRPASKVNWTITSKMIARRARGLKLMKGEIEAFANADRIAAA